MGSVGLVATHTQRRLACAKPVTDATDSTRCSMRVSLLNALSSPVFISEHMGRKNEQICR
jgi:hypothetical protein